MIQNQRTWYTFWILKKKIIAWVKRKQALKVRVSTNNSWILSTITYVNPQIPTDFIWFEYFWLNTNRFRSDTMIVSSDTIGFKYNLHLIQVFCSDTNRFRSNTNWFESDTNQLRSETSRFKSDINNILTWYKPIYIWYKYLDLIQIIWSDTNWFESDTIRLRSDINQFKSISNTKQFQSDSNWFQSDTKLITMSYKPILIWYKSITIWYKQI